MIPTSCYCRCRYHRRNRPTTPRRRPLVVVRAARRGAARPRDGRGGRGGGRRRPHRDVVIAGRARRDAAVARGVASRVRACARPADRHRRDSGTGRPGSPTDRRRRSAWPQRPRPRSPCSSPSRSALHLIAHHVGLSVGGPCQADPLRCRIDARRHPRRRRRWELDVEAAHAVRAGLLTVDVRRRVAAGGVGGDAVCAVVPRHDRGS